MLIRLHLSGQDRAGVAYKCGRNLNLKTKINTHFNTAWYQPTHRKKLATCIGTPLSDLAKMINSYAYVYWIKTSETHKIEC